LPPLTSSPGEQQQRTFAAVDEHELIHGGTAFVLRHGNGTDLATVTDHANGATLADDYFAAGEALFECEEAAGVLRGAADHRKNGDVFIGDRVEDAPVAFRALGCFARMRSGPDEREAPECGDDRQGGNSDSHQETLHKTSLQFGK
jgi:hypothetical protein